MATWVDEFQCLNCSKNGRLSRSMDGVFSIDSEKKMLDVSTEGLCAPFIVTSGDMGLRVSVLAYFVIRIEGSI